MKKQGASRVFTLVELLVVCAVIILLMSLLFPALSKAREKTRQTVCASNMKQFGIGMALYSGDFDSWLMPGYGHPVADGGFQWWAYDLYNLEYIKSFEVFQCPSARPSVRLQNLLLKGVHYGVRGGADFCTYSANWNVGGARFSDGSPRPETFFKTSAVSARVSVIMDGFLHTQYSDGLWTIASSFGIGLVSVTPDAIGYWHSGGSNIIFGDYHVEWYNKSKIIGNMEILK